ncbi:MAG: Holliday junction resolvase RuvX [Thermomicrobiales bacterium]|nr:Holliday junction resolvase RuvX [Thermomicrobiales bacterium]
MSGAGGRALALDVGERRIGVAIADELGLIASPLTIVARGSDSLAEIAALVETRGVDTVVVGLPTGMSGREGPQTAATRRFADELATVLPEAIHVVFWDERLSTAIADRALRDRKASRADRRDQRDAIAAAVILQGWLDAARARERRGRG